MKFLTAIPCTRGPKDSFTGGLAEVPTKGAVVGPPFACLLGRQMYYYKAGKFIHIFYEVFDRDLLLMRSKRQHYWWLGRGSHHGGIVRQK